MSGASDDVLSGEGVEFLHLLAREFGAQRAELLAARQTRAQALRDGELPGFLDATASVRAANWRVPPAPADLADRRVEITGPTERKMVINALNSGARVFMADFEDSNSPTWENMLDGQRNLTDAIARTIALQTPEKTYELNDSVATLLVRPAGICPSATSRSTVSRSRPRCLTSASTCCATTRPWRRWGAARTSICPSSSPIWRRGCGTACSSVRRSCSASRAARSARPC